jgi:hypothetical protein
MHAGALPVFSWSVLEMFKECCRAYISGQSHLNLIGRAATIKFSTFTIRIAFTNAIVDSRMDGRHDESKELC